MNQDVRRLAWAFAGCVLGGVVLIGSLASLDAPPIDGLNDKWHHFLAYGILALWWGLRYSAEMRGAVAVVLFSSGYGALIEIFQYFTPFRSFDMFDIVCNTAGATIGSIFSFSLLKISTLNKYHTKIFS